MEIMRFTLSGRQAFFKKSDVNAYCYFTYGHIHKVALLGILGAVMGYAGYNQMKKDDIFPEFYERLKELEIAIIPIAEKGCFNKKIIGFNNSVGYASGEAGGNLIVREQWLENPKWDIYVKIESEESKYLAEKVCASKCTYIPYLGKNDHPADITNIRIIEGIELKTAQHIDSFFIKGQAMDFDDDDVDYPFKYQEMMPYGLDEINNQYIMRTQILTNMFIQTFNCKVIAIEDEELSGEKKKKNIVFN